MNIIWKPPSLNEFTSYQIKPELTHLCSEISKYCLYVNLFQITSVINSNGSNCTVPSCID